MIAALYVMRNGPYSNVAGIDAWDVSRDARLYKGPHKVIAHPPCERWGRYWGGGPMLHNGPNRKLLGDDNQCFAHALWAVRSFGGVLEHPEASHAWHYYGLTRPKMAGGWTDPDKYGGRSCCVAQGHYGHRAQKLTWLYAVGINFRDLRWGRCPGKIRLDRGAHNKNEYGYRETITAEERVRTPDAFKSLLISLVSR